MGRHHIVGYIALWCLHFFSWISVSFYVIIYILSSRAIDSSVYERLQRASHLYASELRGELPEREGTESGILLGDVGIVVLDSAGQVVLGAYPAEGFPRSAVRQGDKQEGRAVFSCTVNGTVYYYRDKPWWERPGSGRGEPGGAKENIYTIRAFLSQDDAEHPFSAFRNLTIVAFLIEAAVLFVLIMVLRRKVSAPLDEMCQKAVDITQAQGFSGQRMEYSGNFEEIQMLIGAYNEILARAEDQISRQSQFNSDVSHELRTPITIIIAQAELLEERLKKVQNGTQDDAGLESVHMILRQSRRIKDIIAQLLILSRFENSNYSMNKEELDLCDIVEVACEEEAAASDAGDRFVFSLEPVEIMGNIQLLLIAVRNLVSNAVKYSPEEMPVNISCGREASGAFLSVQDFGKGIREEEQAKVFDYYYRGERSRTRQGYGLGLTLVKKIVEKHGGRIELSSKEGTGSTFTIHFPE